MSGLSFVVPAHDEEALIGDTLRTLRASADAAGVPYEIIVVNDASTDRTAAIATAAGARVVDVNVRQIAAARNAGAKVATGDTLIFVDADTWVPPATIRAVVEARRAGVIGGGAVVRADEPMPRYGRVLMPISVWILRTCRWAAGCFLFAERAAFEAVGGFDERLYASEEIALSRALKRRGRFVILPESVTTSSRKMRTYSGFEVFATFLRLGLFPGQLKRRSALHFWYGRRRQDQKKKHT